MSRYHLEDPVVISCSLDEKCQSLLKFSKSLVDSLGSSAHLVHVVEPRYRGNMGVGEFMSYEAIRAVEVNEVEESKNSLKGYKEEYFPNNGDLDVGFGNPSDEILTISKYKKSSLVLCGKGESSYKFIPSGFSVPLSLMSDSNIPVMIVPNNAKIWKKEGLNILICDDLSDGSKEAILFSKDLARKQKGSSIHHINIIEDHHFGLVDAIKTLKDKINPNNYVYDQEYDAKEYQKSMKEKAEKELLQRMGSNEDKNFSYKSSVLLGWMAEELRRIVKKEDIDLVVFGKHKFIHKKPFGIGKMPFNAMLELDIPVVVVPS